MFFFSFVNTNKKPCNNHDDFPPRKFRLENFIIFRGHFRAESSTIFKKVVNHFQKSLIVDAGLGSKYASAFTWRPFKLFVSLKYLLFLLIHQTCCYKYLIIKLFNLVSIDWNKNIY